MQKQFVLILADAMRAYYSSDELQELFEMFDCPLDWDHQIQQPSHLSTAKRLVTEIEHGNNHRLLDGLLPSLFARNSEMIAKTSFEARDFHEEMSTRLAKLRPLLEGAAIPIEIAIPDERPFTAKSEIRELVAKANSQILLVDPYVGVSTLDCFRNVQQHLRILTGQNKQSVESGFEAAVKDFRSEGHLLEIRRHKMLHDRYLIFNDRCWLIGSSIKDAGKKALNIIECLDSKTAITSDAEKKWSEGVAFL